MTNHSPAPSRTFTSPSGRRWSASLAVAPARSGRELALVLRFTAEELVLDLEGFPGDWETLPDDELVALVRMAQPPRLGLPRDRATTPRTGGM